MIATRHNCIFASLLSAVGEVQLKLESFRQKYECLVLLFSLKMSTAYVLQYAKVSSLWGAGKFGMTALLGPLAVFLALL